MICDRCGKREATIKYVQIINGNKQELHLCSNCGREVGVSDFNMPLDLSGFFGELFSNYDMQVLSKKQNIVCENCGTNFEDFLNTGKLGCANCYKVFEKKLSPILKRIQGSNEYLGNSSQDTTIEKIDKSENEKDKKIKNLEEKLKKCIKEENYEEAAKIRDELKILKGGNN